jgi:small neutral amino acid transporter SnatA (MarC family)
MVFPCSHALEDLTAEQESRTNAQLGLSEPESVPSLKVMVVNFAHPALIAPLVLQTTISILAHKEHIVNELLPWVPSMVSGHLTW